MNLDKPACSISQHEITFDLEFLLKDPTKPYSKEKIIQSKDFYFDSKSSSYEFSGLMIENIYDNPLNFSLSSSESELSYRFTPSSGTIPPKDKFKVALRLRTEDINSLISKRTSDQIQDGIDEINEQMIDSISLETRIPEENVTGRETIQIIINSKFSKLNNEGAKLVREVSNVDLSQSILLKNKNQKESKNEKEKSKEPTLDKPLKGILKKPSSTTSSPLSTPKHTRIRSSSNEIRLRTQNYAMPNWLPLCSGLLVAFLACYDGDMTLKDLKHIFVSYCIALGAMYMYLRFERDFERRE